MLSTLLYVTRRISRSMRPACPTGGARITVHFAFAAGPAHAFAETDFSTCFKVAALARSKIRRDPAFSRAFASYSEMKMCSRHAFAGCTKEEEYDVGSAAAPCNFLENERGGSLRSTIEEEAREESQRANWIFGTGSRPCTQKSGKKLDEVFLRGQAGKLTRRIQGNLDAVI